jgi:hypothetical protein
MFCICARVRRGDVVLQEIHCYIYSLYTGVPQIPRHKIVSVTNCNSVAIGFVLWGENRANYQIAIKCCLAWVSLNYLFCYLCNFIFMQETLSICPSV